MERGMCFCFLGNAEAGFSDRTRDIFNPWQVLPTLCKFREDLAEQKKTNGFFEP